MSIKTKLTEEFNSELDELAKMEVGTDEYKTTVDGVAKLADRIIAIEAAEAERENRAIDRQVDIEHKMKQLADEKHDKIVKNCIAVVTFVGGLVTTLTISIMSMNFEREGTFTTEAGKSSIRELLRIKR